MTTIADVVTSTLERCGVDTVFGLPGTQNVGLFDALRRSRIRTVVSTHELAAGFMANGYARASGRVGVVAAIQGPGFTYALTALAEARHDSAPLLLLTGAPDHTRPFALQALDQTAMVTSVAKAVIRGSAADLAEQVARAYELALTGEPGPVVLEVAQWGELSGGPAAASRSDQPGVAEPADVGQLITLLRQSRRPFFYAGQGCAPAAAALRRLIEQLSAPLATSLSGRGVVPENHPLVLCLDQQPGGIERLNRIIASSDLTVVLGCKLAHNGTGGFQLSFPPDRLVHVDASAEVLGANYPARLALQADVPALLDRLSAVDWSRSDWKSEEIDAARQGLEAQPVPEPNVSGVTPPTPAGFFAALRAALPDDAILTLDSGQHQMLARRHFRVLSPRGVIAPSDFQSMGFGLPAAIGAALAVPSRRVVALIGDGGFAMSGLELLTAVRERIPLTVIVFCDGNLGLIREQQLREYGHSHGIRLASMDLEGLAASVGARYVRVEGDTAALSGAPGEPQGPTIVEVQVGDSIATRRQHAAGLARATVRRAIGPRWLGVLKGWFR